MDVFMLLITFVQAGHTPSQTPLLSSSVLQSRPADSTAGRLKLNGNIKPFLQNQSQANQQEIKLNPLKHIVQSCTD